MVSMATVLSFDTYIFSQIMPYKIKFIVRSNVNRPVYETSQTGP